MSDRVFRVLLLIGIAALQAFSLNPDESAEEIEKQLEHATTRQDWPGALEAQIKLHVHYREAKGESDPIMVTMLNRLGGFHMAIAGEAQKNLGPMGSLNQAHKDHYAKANTYLNQALSLGEEVLPAYHHQKMVTHRLLGMWHQNHFQFGEALTSFQRAGGMAEALYHEAREAGGEVNPLLDVVLETATYQARLYMLQARWDEFLRVNQDLCDYGALRYGINSPQVKAYLADRVAPFLSMNREKEAEAVLEDVIRWFEAHSPNDPQMALSLNNLGTIHYKRGNYDRAATLFERALAIEGKHGNGPSLERIQVMNNLAGIYNAEGRSKDAQRLMTEALALCRQGNFMGELSTAQVYENLAIALENGPGRYDLCLDALEKACIIRRRYMGDTHPDVRRLEADILHMRTILGDTGDPEVVYLQLIDRPDTSLEEQVDDIMRLIAFYWRSSRLDEARLLITRKLSELGDEDTNHRLRGRLQGTLAMIYLAQRQYPDARCHLQNANYHLDRLPSFHPDRAKFHLLQAMVSDHLENDPIAMREHVLKGLTIAETHGNGLLAAYLQAFLLASLAQDHPLSTVFWGKLAANHFQKERGRLFRIDPWLESIFREDRGTLYHLVTGSFISLGRLPEALQILRFEKEERFQLDAPVPENKPVFAKAQFRSKEQYWLEAYEDLIMSFRASPHREDQIEGYHRLRNLKRFVADINQDLYEDGPVRTSTSNNALAPGTARLTYLVALGSTKMILETQHGQDVFSLPVERGELNLTIFAFRQHLAEKSQLELVVSYGQQLYEWLVAPMVPQLRERGITDLRLVLDDALIYLPFGALHDGRQYLAETYRISRETIQTETLEPGPLSLEKGISAFGTATAPGMEPLDMTLRELAAIVKTNGPDDGLFPGTLRINKAFTLAGLQQDLSEGRPLVHIASHFIYQPGAEDASFLWLGDGTRLTVRQMVEMEGLFAGVRLLILSACDTAVAGNQGRGRELEGFAVLAQRLGARKVMASLWPVSDLGSFALMVHFYTILAENPDWPEVRCLQEAQKRLLTGQGGASGFEHPYYWAPFVLMVPRL